MIRPTPRRCDCGAHWCTVSIRGLQTFFRCIPCWKKWRRVYA